MAKSEDGDAIGSQRMIKKEAEKDKILVSTAEHRIIHLNIIFYSVSHCLYWVVYSSKVAIIITWEITIISLLFVQTLKTLEWN